MDKGGELDSDGQAWMSEWMPEQMSEWTSEQSWMSRVQTCRYEKGMFLGRGQRQGSVSKLINMLGSLEGLPSLSLYTGALANITNQIGKVTMKITLEKGKVKPYEKEKHWNARPNWVRVVR